MTVLIERAPRVQRPILRRIIVQGTLKLMTPAHFGSGDADGATDLELLRDSISDKALLTGSTIGGALRNYLRGYQQGYRVAEPGTNSLFSKGRAELLFGGRKGDDAGSQSPLIIADAVSTAVPSVDLRDNVRIDGRVRTAAQKGKFDYELLAAGTEFSLEFELTLGELPRGTPNTALDQQRYHALLIEGLMIALRGLADGKIAIGMKKRRGFGACTVETWKVWDFDLSDRKQLRNWLVFRHDGLRHTYNQPEITLEQLEEKLERNVLTTPLQPVAAQLFAVEATFGLHDSLLIRSGQDVANGPDVVHLQARQANGQHMPIISGTSLAGVLRHQMIRIANTIVPDSGADFAQKVFGFVGGGGQAGSASRLRVEESVVTNAVSDLVQSRVGIDRFTGGAYDGALFSEQPLFTTSTARVTLRFALENPTPAERGMLLLLLKDLWTAHVAIGGEASIGRGRLVGLSATISDGTGVIASMTTDQPQGLKLQDGDAAQLNGWVTALREELISQQAAQEAANEPA